jgi:hypothetical protein
MTTRYTRGLLLGALWLAAAPAALAAQTLPTAQSLTAKYVQAIGGRDAVLAQRNSHTKGSFEMPAAGLTGEMEAYASMPRMVNIITVPGLGVIRSGFDGTTAWSLDPFQGARVLTDSELQQMKDQTNPLAAVRDASLFTSMETVERTEIAGRACYRVKFVWKSTGKTTSDCYDAENGLLVATTSTTESPMGSIESTMVFTDYRQFGAVKMPTRMTQEMMGAQQIFTISSVEFGPIDPSVFELPAEIRAQVGGE